MKISILVTNSLKVDPRVIKQVKIAMQNGYEVQFVGFMDAFYDKDFLDNLGCRYDIIDIGEKYLFKLKYLHEKVYRQFARNRKAKKVIENFNPDIIHANDFDTLEMAYKAAKKCGAKIIYDSHEIFAENIGIAESKLMKKYVIMTEKRLLKKIDKMIAVSNAAAEYFKEKYSIEIPTVVTNCPMKNIVPLREKTSDKFEVVFQGRFTRGRGYEEFILAGKYLNDDIRLIIRGFGAIEDDLKALAREEGLDGKVQFDKAVDVAEVVSAASSSHIGIVTTIPININFELSVSNKLFEYAAAGLPVIMSDIPEHRYLNNKYNFGVIINEVTPECIADAINCLYNDKKKYESLAKNAKKMTEEMNWEEESKKLLCIYNELGQH